MNKYNETLMKFINTQNQKIREDVSRQGYKDNSPYRNNPSNTIYGTPQGTPITMKGVSKRLIGTDEFGNQQYMEPGQEYYFPGSEVREQEMPIAQFGKQQREELVNKVGNYTYDYMQSPRYEEMLRNSSENDDDYKDMNNSRFNNLGNTTVTFPTPGFKNRFDKTILANADDNGTIKMFPHAQGNAAYSILAHEFSHSVDRKNGVNRVIPLKDVKLMQNYAESSDKWKELISQPDKELFSNKRDNTFKEGLKKNIDRITYLAEPTETRARLNDIRYDSKSNNIYDPFNQKVTPDILNGIRNSKSSEAYNDLREIYTDDQIMDMLNTVSQTNRPPASIPIAKYGGLLNKTITCSNCGWSWKAADGGNDVSTCHKCGNENKVMEYGGSYDPLHKFNSVAIETTPKIKNTSNAVELAILINNQASLFNTTNNWLDNL